MGPPGHVAGAVPPVVAAFNAQAFGDEGVRDGPTSQARRGPNQSGLALLRQSRLLK